MMKLLFVSFALGIQLVVIVRLRMLTKTMKLLVEPLLLHKVLMKALPLLVG